MTGHLKLLLAAASIGLFAQGANAQMATPITRVAGATIESNGFQKSGSASNRWACAAGASMEIGEVSNDVAGQPARYVLVHRQGEEVVASQRLSATEVIAYRNLSCPGQSEVRLIVG